MDRASAVVLGYAGKLTSEISESWTSNNSRCSPLALQTSFRAWNRKEKPVKFPTLTFS
jgi:hypothetical protein